jgi:Fe-Mn family superoxide dismutase
MGAVDRRCLMFELPPLPYDYDALEPTISTDTLHFHHDKHHRAYVEKTNKLAGATGLDGRPLEEVVREARRAGNTQLFNNAAQAWNHAFFWQCMTPDAGQPSGDFARALEQGFGSVDDFKAAFAKEGEGHFASGWVWLVTGAEGLKVISTHDADDTLVREGVFPLLVCDLWEHAYYLDYQNDRAAFLKAWLDKTANWAFAERQLAAANGQGDGFRHPAPAAGEGRPGEAGEQPRPAA